MDTSSLLQPVPTSVSNNGNPVSFPSLQHFIPYVLDSVLADKITLAFRTLPLSFEPLQRNSRELLFQLPVPNFVSIHHLLYYSSGI
jgi:hypothetical protein